eukprot:763663-Hanusia_phi.AAC.7
MDLFLDHTGCPTPHPPPRCLPQQEQECSLKAPGQRWGRGGRSRMHRCGGWTEAERAARMFLRGDAEVDNSDRAGALTQL